MTNSTFSCLCNLSFLQILQIEQMGSYLTDHIHVEVGQVMFQLSIPEANVCQFHVRSEPPSVRIEAVECEFITCCSSTLIVLQLCLFEAPLMGGLTQHLQIHLNPGTDGSCVGTASVASHPDSSLMFYVCLCKRKYIF